MKSKEIIRPCGLSPMKSKGIHGLSKILIDKYNGEVPQNFESLEALPAVGHKACQCSYGASIWYTCISC